MKLGESGQIMMFGQTITDMRSAAERGGYELNKASECSRYAMAILSDVQEELNLGGADHIETARQFLNKAKYFIRESIDAPER